MSSYDEALEYVKDTIATIKAAREHPIVQDMRKAGFGPENVTLFRIDHTAFDRRFVFLTDAVIEMGSDAFAVFYDHLMTEHDDVPEARELAKSLILEAAPQFVTEADTCFLQRPKGEARCGVTQSAEGRADYLHEHGDDE